MWSGNWVLGRALRDAFDPLTLNFWRWTIALAVLAPFAAAGLAAKREVIRRHLGLLALLALLGVALFQSLVYLGLRSTTAINAVLLNSSAPLFMLLVSWILERERAAWRQLAGIAISLGGILIILTQGDLARLRELEFHAGDGWILLAMPLWGLYSVLLKRRPKELDGVEFLLVLSVLGVAMLAPFYALDTVLAPASWPGWPALAALLYVGLAASVAAFILWNRGVAVVGANAAGFTLHLLPAFGTLLAIVFLGEQFAAYHAIGVATILAGVVLATA
jgi:drug/metabolite transporter (DMT)-like permease